METILQFNSFEFGIQNIIVINVFFFILGLRFIWIAIVLFRECLQPHKNLNGMFFFFKFHGNSIQILTHCMFITQMCDWFLNFPTVLDLLSYYFIWNLFEFENLSIYLLYRIIHFWKLGLCDWVDMTVVDK